MSNFKRFYRPGAMHKARWMAKLLYAIKMVLLGSIIQRDLPKGQIFARGQLVKLKRFVLFTVFYYVPWWLTSPISSSAPKNDLLLIRSLEHYRTQDSTIGKAALNAFKNQLWYLTEELVCLALFSSTVDSSVKAKMALKLVSLPFTGLCESRKGNGFKKPQFPELPPDDSDLSFFVGKDSWSFFKQ